MLIAVGIIVRIRVLCRGENWRRKRMSGRVLIYGEFSWPGERGRGGGSGVKCRRMRYGNEKKSEERRGKDSTVYGRRTISF